MMQLSSPAAPGSGEPHLESVEDGVLLSWTEPLDGAHALMVSRLVGSAWTDPVPVVARDSLFVNWADFGLVASTGPGTLAAHWLVRGPSGGVDYRIEVATSDDGGATWSESWTPHEDGTPTEHGFVSYVAMPGGGTGIAWLDGRDYANRQTPESAGSHTSAGGEMSLRFRSLGLDGARSPEVVLDGRTCDCCQTAAAATRLGPVVAYRDRTEDEVRDISIVRWTPQGWTEPVPVHEDGWEIPGCPVNGPAMDARGDDVVIAWYTGATGHGQVKAAFSDDSGGTFGPPVLVDDGNPEGRVDAVLARDGTAWISWLERTEDGADVRVRTLRAGQAPSESVVVAASSRSRAAGFPRMASDPLGGLVLAWTDPSEPSAVRVARLSSARR